MFIWGREEGMVLLKPIMSECLSTEAVYKSRGMGSSFESYQKNVSLLFKRTLGS